MKVVKTNITSVMQTTCRELESLKSKIGDDLEHVNPQDLQHTISDLHHTVNALSREINQSRSLDPVDGKLKTSLVSLMQAIQHTPAFSQALGQYQTELLTIFKRIENSIKRAEAKVTKVDFERLSP